MGNAVLHGTRGYRPAQPVAVHIVVDERNSSCQWCCALNSDAAGILMLRT
jgi:hypothetical protein